MLLTEATLWGLHDNNQRKPKLLQQIHLACIRRGYSPRTAKSYIYWCRQYIYFHNKSHPATLKKSHVEMFLNHLAINKHLSTSSQSIALNALVFLYQNVLDIEIGWLDNLIRPKRKKHLPTVLSHHEVSAILGETTGTNQLIAALIYGTGLRVSECVKLRIKDLDFDLNTTLVTNGKGGKDRATLLPKNLHVTLRKHILKCRQQHKDDVLSGAGYTPLPGALYKKYPKAAQSIGWQFLFPSAVKRVWPDTGQTVRWHMSPNASAFF